MSFDTIERSNYAGKPVVLYEFKLGSNRWRYTNAQRNIPFGGQTYTAIGISHDGISMSGDPTADDLTINLSAKAEVTDLYIGTPPSDPLEIAIRSLHHGDTDAPVVWSGTVKSARRVSMVEWAFTCNSLLSSLNRNGLRLFWQRGCQHILYDRECRVNPDDYATTVQVSGKTGTSLTSATLGTLESGYLAGGYLSFTGPYGTTERRAIERHVGSTIHLLSATDGIDVGQWITVYPGCNRTSPMCEQRFNNIDNFGGFPHLPNQSPFDGDPIF